MARFTNGQSGTSLPKPHSAKRDSSARSIAGARVETIMALNRAVSTETPPSTSQRMRAPSPPAATRNLRSIS